MVVGEIASKVIVSELIKKAFPTILEKIDNIKEDIAHSYKNKFTVYLEKEYEYLDNSTSQLFRNTKYKISKLYIPLTLESFDLRQKIIVNKFPKELFKETNKILIKDTAGMGKSTLLKMIFRYSIDDKQYIPFYIDLKSLIKEDKVLSVMDIYVDNFPSFTEIPSKDFLKRMFEKGKFIFLFDGADEVGDTFKEKVFMEINKFIKISSNSKFIIATREEEKIISSFNHFIPFRIKELSKNEAYDLIRKYDTNNDIADNLIREINKKENKTVFDFLVNPLLTTLLFTAYSYNKKIPLKKNLFYKQVYESLFENHDSSKIGYLSREKKSGLDIDDFERVLGHFSYIGRSREKLEYTKDELIAIFNKINESHPSISFCSKDFLQDIVSRVPVLRQEGNKYIWQHKSIQEYFFVRFFLRVLNDEQKEMIINQIFNSGEVNKYRLIFDILFDEDTEYFHKALTMKLYNYMSEKIDSLEKDNELNIIDIFYRYLITQVEPKFNYNKIESEYHNFLDKLFVNEDERINLINNFQLISVSTSITSNMKPKKLFLSANKYYIILDILSIKKSEFTYFFKRKEDYNKDSFEYIHNFNCSTSKDNIRLLMRISIRRLVLIDYKKFKDFIKDFKEREKKKEQLITDFYINF